MAFLRARRYPTSGFLTDVTVFFLDFRFKGLLTWGLRTLPPFWPAGVGGVVWNDLVSTVDDEEDGRMTGRARRVAEHDRERVDDWRRERPVHLQQAEEAIAIVS